MRAWAGALGLAVALVAPPAPAWAHGREPVLGAIAFDPLDPDHLVVRSTWALLESHDGGARFGWRCATAVGFDRTSEDPPVVIASDHRVLAGVFNGLARGDAEGCGYALSEEPEVYRLYVIDMVRDPITPSTIWAITSPGDQPNTVLRSTDDGANWEVRGAPHPTVLLERIRVAPSDPSRIYVSGVVPRRTDAPRRALVFGSRDGGRTFTETEIPLTGEERNVHVLAVDPADPERALFRIVRPVVDTVPERLLLSEDGGSTFTTAASLLEITGCTFSADGSQAWVGGWDGAFLRSDARGAAGTFLPVPGQETLRVRCLHHRAAAGPGPDELWICADDLRGEFALGRSTDGGSSIVPVWGFSDAASDTGCPRCSAVGTTCPGYWPDVVFDLGLPMDAGVFDPDAGLARCDGSMEPGAAPRAAGCSCRVERREPSPTPWVALALALCARRRRRAPA
jgi:MYXO-CTERM domain-containing protein